MKVWWPECRRGSRAMTEWLQGDHSFRKIIFHGFSMTFQDFPWPMLFSMTIQAWNLVFLNPMTFQAQWSPCDCWLQWLVSHWTVVWQWTGTSLEFYTCALCWHTTLSSWSSTVLSQHGWTTPTHYCMARLPPTSPEAPSLPSPPRCSTGAWEHFNVLQWSLRQSPVAKSNFGVTFEEQARHRMPKI